jgi:hypothetical protein
MGASFRFAGDPLGIRSRPRGESAQIQFLLGRGSIQTMARYLSCG